MLSLAIELQVFSQGDSFLIITIDYYQLRGFILYNLLKKSIKLDSFFSSLYFTYILSLISRQYYYQLVFRLLANYSTSYIKNIFSSRSLCSLIINLIKISIAYQVIKSLLVNKLLVNYYLQVLKNLFNSSYIGLSKVRGEVGDY